MTSLLTLLHPKFIHRKTFRSAGEDNIHIYKLTNCRRSTFPPRQPDLLRRIHTDRSGMNVNLYDYEQRRNIEQQSLVKWNYS